MRRHTGHHRTQSSFDLGLRVHLDFHIHYLWPERKWINDGGRFVRLTGVNRCEPHTQISVQWRDVGNLHRNIISISELGPHLNIDSTLAPVDVYVSRIYAAAIETATEGI